jgi:hypothetical protein
VFDARGLAEVNWDLLPKEILMSKRQVSKGLFYLAAFLSFLLSVYLYFFAGSPEQAIYVGLWVPSILSLGALMFGGRQ